MSLPGADLFLEMLRKPEVVIKSLLEQIDKSHRETKSYVRRIEAFEAGKSPKVEVMLQSIAKTLIEQQKTNQILIVICLAYMGGDNFKSDAMRVTSKLGKSEEAFQAFVKDKFGGRL